MIYDPQLFVVIPTLNFLFLSPPQVKQIMEEAVTRKFVHEDSGHIVSFCGKSSAGPLSEMGWKN